MDIEINQGHLKGLIKKTNPDLIKQPLAEMMKDAANLGRAVARHNLSGGTEQAKISMRSDVKPLAAKVYSVMPQARAMSIEEGRPPGQPPSLLATARWLLKRKNLSQRRMSELAEAERVRIENAQEAIRQHGAKGKAFIGGAAMAVRRDLPRLLGVVAQKIESGFRK